MKGEGPWRGGVRRPDSWLLLQPAGQDVAVEGYGLTILLTRRTPEAPIGGQPLFIDGQSAWLYCLH